MDTDERFMRAQCSLEGLSVGDAFGERFFVHPAAVERMVESRTVPSPPWHFTDDTQMALSVVSVLRRCGGIDQDQLGTSFSAHYDPRRGYGDAMNRLLPMIWLPGAWRSLSQRLFGGQGSFGNGAAMRVAPVGAYFADDLEAAAEHARLSAEVTHTHAEAAAGAIAVAVAAARAVQLRGRPAPGRAAFVDSILPSVPASEVRERMEEARDLPPETRVLTAANVLGSGDLVSAQDTVPFVLWCAGERLADFEEALWLTVSGLGDRDTTCAMVGGIVSLYTGMDGIPKAWRQAREPLPGWPYEQRER